jgi:hypothetical protein
LLYLQELIIIYTPSLPLYEELDWDASTLLSAQNLNHSETQYSLLKNIIDGHNHDDEIFTRTLTDSLFFSPSFMGADARVDADKLDGQHLSDIIATVLPIGSIIWFNKPEDEIPTGWKMCNGQTGTTDYRDRFLIGAGDLYSVGWTGGPTTWNGNITPTGSINVGSHAVTTSEMPYHAHNFSDQHNPSGATGSWISADSIPATNISYSANTSSTGGGSGHTHTGSTISISAFDPRPQYYALYLIKKVS